MRQYIIKMDYQENYTLQIEGGFNSENQLGRLISHLFSDDYIYGHRSFRKLIEEDRKGYIDIGQLLQNQSIQKYFEHIDINKQEHQLIFIKSTIQIYCPQLHYHHQRVRRIAPWKRNIIKQTKPFSIQKIKANFSISDVRQHLSDNCFTTNQSIKPEKQFVFLYSQKHAQMPETEQRPFQIISYSQICKETARRSKAWASYEQRNYRPLQYFHNQKYPYRFESHYLSGGSEKIIFRQDSNEGSIQLADFIKIAKQANIGLNEMLSEYIDKC